MKNLTSKFRFVGLNDELEVVGKLTVDSGQWIVSEMENAKSEIFSLSLCWQIASVAADVPVRPV